MSNPHQDWKPVVWTKKKTPQQSGNVKKVSKTNLNSNKLTGTGKKINDDDGEIMANPTVGLAIGKQIAQARTAKKLSQKQLAQQMCIQPAIVQQNENGKAIRNNGLLARFERALGTKFDR